jgi:endonuclease-3
MIRRTKALRIPVRAALRRKTARVARALEGSLGVPRQAGKPPLPLDMLIATILSQNTNDKNSHRAYLLLRRKYRNWEAVARAPRAGIRAAIRTGGMANQKSARIKEVLASVKTTYGAYNLSALRLFDDDEVISRLTQLNGVGVKTAACVLLFSFGRDVFPVDTHVHRVCSRLGLAPGSRTPEQTFLAMRGRVPAGKAHAFHTNLIRFGRRVCRSNNPACALCPVYAECVYPGKGHRAGRTSRPSGTDHDFMLLDSI